MIIVEPPESIPWDGKYRLEETTDRTLITELRTRI